MNSQSFEVALLPSMVEPEWLVGRTVVVVDVLRATSTIASALASGATCIVPQPDIETARQTHQRLGAESRLGGERGGRKVAGFHGGNSPREYTREFIGGRTLILATTNGTVAMERCRQAKTVLTGAFLNLGAVCREVSEHPEVTIVCSGTDGRITSEDVLFAGALARSLQQSAVKRGHEFKTNDSAALAMNHWSEVSRAIDSGESTLADFFRTAHGGINLVRIGHDADVVFASQIDTLDVVPVLDLDRWTISVSDCVAK